LPKTQPTLRDDDPARDVANDNSSAIANDRHGRLGAANDNRPLAANDNLRSTTEIVDLGVVGMGPGGLSLLQAAAAAGLPHVGYDQAECAQTIMGFARGKPLTGAPVDQFLRGGFPFCNGMTTREWVLEQVSEIVASNTLNIKSNTRVKKVVRRSDHIFEIHPEPSGFIRCKNVAIAIGPGAPRKLNVPGEDHPIVRYSLSDPAEFKDQCVAVWGGGNAGVENALQLQQHGAKVHIFTRGPGFDKANPANAAQIWDAINRGLIWHFRDAKISRIDPSGIAFTCPEGDGYLPRVDCLFAQLGFHEPREFLKDCGLPEQPTLSGIGEVLEMPGMFLVGAISGRPLIWQVIEQGYEVVESILGNPAQPAHIHRLASKMSAAGLPPEISDLAETFQEL